MVKKVKMVVVTGRLKLPHFLCVLGCMLKWVELRSHCLGRHLDFFDHTLVTAWLLSKAVLKPSGSPVQGWRWQVAKSILPKGVALALVRFR